MFGTSHIIIQTPDGEQLELDIPTLLKFGVHLAKNEQQELTAISSKIHRKHGENLVSKSFENAAKSQEMVVAMIDYLSENNHNLNPITLNMMMLLRHAAKHDIDNAKNFLKHNSL